MEYPNVMLLLRLSVDQFFGGALEFFCLPGLFGLFFHLLKFNYYLFVVVIWSAHPGQQFFFKINVYTVTVYI